MDRFPFRSVQKRDGGLTCEDRLNRALKGLLPDQDHEFHDLVYFWLRRKLFLRKYGDRIRVGVRPMYDKHLEMDERANSQIHARVGPIVLDKLLTLLPLVSEAQMEDSVEDELRGHHGCYRCRHYASAWDRRSERRVDSSWAFPACAIYGFIPPVCLDFILSEHCSDCGIPVAYDPKGETGRSGPLKCRIDLER